MPMREIGYSTIVEENIKNSIREGSADAVKVGFGESYLNAFAIKAMNATSFQIGLLSAIPMLLGYISNLFSIDIIDKIKDRKKIVKIGMIANALSLPLIFLCVFLQSYGIFLLILFTTLYFISALFTMPAWISLMGDIIPDKIKGKFFGIRNRITSFADFAAFILAGLILHKVSAINTIYAFGIIFLIAMVFKLICLFYFSKIYEPEYVVEEYTKFSFMDFIKNLKKTNFGMFVIFICIFTFSVRIAAPFFVVYMLRDLNLSFFEFTLINAASVITTVLSMPSWGKYADIFGNRKIMKITSMLIPLIPLLWMFSNSVIYLFIVELFSGFVWAGFNLAVFNFVFDATSAEKRARAYSYYNVLIGISVFMGSTLGGYLTTINVGFTNSIFFVFMISSILRFLTSILFLPKIKEPKKVKHISGIKLLWVASGAEIWKSLHHRIHVKTEKKRKSIFEKIIEELASIDEDAGGRI